MRIPNKVVAIFLSTLAGQCLADDAVDYGYWLEPKTNVEVHLYSCPQDTALLCGSIIGIPANKASTDVNNPDPSLRSRTLKGLEIVQNFQPVEEKVWEGGGDYGKRPGRIYLPVNGDTLGDHKNRYRIEIQEARVVISVANCSLFNCLSKNEWRKIEVRKTAAETSS